MSPRSPLIIAHRGSSAHAPENTFAAFRRAIADGADGIEFDVRLSADGVPVVFHDDDLKRTAGRPERIDSIGSAELARIDIGSWFNKAFPQRARTEFAGERIQTLSDTLEFLAKFNGRIYVELKCTDLDAGALVGAVCEMLRESPLLPQIIVKSFTLAAIPLVRGLCPAVRTAALFEPTVRSMISKQRNIIDLALRAGADELSLHFSLATRRLARLASLQNMPITMWTVDDPKWLTKADERRIRALISNDPKRMIESRKAP